MDDVKRINDLLEKYPQDIYDATIGTESAREAWQLVVAKSDYERAKAFLEAKAADFTVAEAEASATKTVYQTTMDGIMAEAKYRKALADQLRVENEFTAIRKQANLLELTLQHTKGTI